MDRRRRAAPTLPPRWRDLMVWFPGASIGNVAAAAAITTWPDRGPAARDATQASAPNRPTHTQVLLNGQPGAAFAITDQRLLTASITHSIGTGPFTVWAVVRHASVASNYRAIGANGTYEPAVYIHQSKPHLYHATDYAWSTTLVSSVWYLLCWIRSGSAVTCYVNGRQDATTHTIADSWPDAAWAVGSESAAGATFGGDIAEQGVYGAALGTGDRQQLERYIRQKYLFF